MHQLCLRASSDSVRVAAPLALLAVERGAAQANKRSAVSTNVVLIGAELTTLGGDTFELLLGSSVGVADVHEEALLAESATVVLVNDIVAVLAIIETEKESVDSTAKQGKENSPSEPNATAVAHTVAENLAGDNLLLAEDDTELLPEDWCQDTHLIEPRWQQAKGVKTHHFGHVLRQVGDVQVGRATITLSLETRVEGLLLKVSCDHRYRARGTHARAKPTS